MSTLADLPVLVLGLGDSGLAMARRCARAGARLRVWDSRDQPPNAAALRAQLPDAMIESGEPVLGEARLVLKSPGLAPADPRIAPLLAAARAAGVRESHTVTFAPCATHQRAMARPLSPRPSTRTGMSASQLI